MCSLYDEQREREKVIERERSEFRMLQQRQQWEIEELKEKMEKERQEMQMHDMLLRANRASAQVGDRRELFVHVSGTRPEDMQRMTEELARAAVTEDLVTERARRRQSLPATPLKDPENQAEVERDWEREERQMREREMVREIRDREMAPEDLQGESFHESEWESEWERKESDWESEWERKESDWESEGSEISDEGDGERGEGSEEGSDREW